MTIARRRDLGRSVTAHAVLGFFTVLALAPVLLILMNAFKTRAAIFGAPQSHIIDVRRQIFIELTGESKSLRIDDGFRENRAQNRAPAFRRQLRQRSAAGKHNVVQMRRNKKCGFHKVFLYNRCGAARYRQSSISVFKFQSHRGFSVFARS